jgi:hypothetical protein
MRLTLVDRSEPSIATVAAAPGAIARAAAGTLSERRLVGWA